MNVYTLNYKIIKNTFLSSTNQFEWLSTSPKLLSCTFYDVSSSTDWCPSPVMYSFKHPSLDIPPLTTRCSAAKREVPTHRHAAEWQQLWYSNFEEFQRLTEPSFDNNTVSNITVQLGGTAFLHCRVRNLGERTVT